MAIGTGTAILGSAVLGGAMQSSAASKAAYAQRVANEQAMDEQRRQYDQTREDLAPWRAAGGNALQRLAGDIERMPTAQEVMAQPGYQFGLQQGQQALDRRQAAAGGRISGRAMKAGARYATDYAASGYNAEYQRRQDRLNRLAALAGIGQTATGASAAAGANSANAISGMLMQGGANAGAARLAQGSIWGNALGDVSAQYLRSQQQQPSWSPQFFGPTWQQQGGSMDTGSYGDYGYMGGP
jgi:hypothetical protein